MLSASPASYRHCQWLSLLGDEHGRSALDVSSPLVKVTLESRLLFCGRYELQDPPAHVSQTCQVMFAKDHRPRFDHYERIARIGSLNMNKEEIGAFSSSSLTSSTISASLGSQELPVALKFMRSRKVRILNNTL